MKKELDKDKYEMNQKGYMKILNDYYAGPIEALDKLDDTSPYYLIKKDGLKLLVNIHNYILEVIELPENTNNKKFTYGKNSFKQFKKDLGFPKSFIFQWQG